MTHKYIVDSLHICVISTTVLVRLCSLKVTEKYSYETMMTCMSDMRFLYKHIRTDEDATKLQEDLTSLEQRKLQEPWVNGFPSTQPERL